MKRNLFGKKMMIVGEVEEHLTLNSKQWITIRLPDNSLITINLKHCKEIKDES